MNPGQRATQPAAVTPAGATATDSQGLLLLTLPEVAARLRLGLRTVKTMRAAGALRVVTFGRAVRVEPSEVLRLIAEARR